MVAEVRFKQPPVREVTLTVFFDALPTLQVSHLATLISAWQEEFPKTDELPPALPWRESARSAAALLAPGSKWPFPRLWLSNSGSDRSIQIDNDRVAFTWHFAEGGQYPSYLALRRQFGALYAQFDEAAERETGERPQPRRAEAQYSNELRTDDARTVLLRLVGAQESTGEASGADYVSFRLHRCAAPSTEDCTVNVSVDMETGTGSPYASMALNTSKDVTPDLDVWDALDQAHDALIGEFMRATDDDMRKQWDRQQ